LIGDPQNNVFDDLAGSYDEQFTSRLSGQWLRSIVLERVTPLLPDRASILDIGCGTGEDAIHFARLGHTVMATDISAAMLQQTRGKLAELAPDVRNRVQTQSFDAADPELSDLKCNDDLDLVFSNFGALNCVADLRPLFDYAEHRLKPGGHLAITLMGPFCFWETLGFALRGDVRRATRRWSGRSQFSASSIVQDVFYPSVGAIKRSMPPGLRPIGTYGIGALVPSSDFFSLCDRWPGLFRRLSIIDNAIAGWWPVSRVSDHFLILMQKERTL